MFFRHDPRTFSALPLLLGITLAAFSTMLPVAARAEQEDPFPIIFTDPASLAEIGIELKQPAFEDPDGGQGRFRNLCYDTGSAIFSGTPRAVSDAMLARYKAKGFTLETLCIGLKSQAKFNPETGARLATYVYRNDREAFAGLEANADQMASDPEIVPKIFASKAAFSSAIEQFKLGKTSGLSIEAR